MPVLRFEDLAVQPWRNGGGVTREIWRLPAPAAGSGAGFAAAAEFDIRVSIADVAASGPFSSYPGARRTILLLDGPGMRLRHTDTGRTVELHAGLPYEFDGADPVYCEIDAPTRDLNLMVRDAAAVGAMDLVADSALACEGASLVVVVGIGEGETVVRAPGAAEGEGADRISLGRLDCLVLPGPCPSIEVDGRAAILTASLTAPSAPMGSNG